MFGDPHIAKFSQIFCMFGKLSSQAMPMRIHIAYLQLLLNLYYTVGSNGACPTAEHKDNKKICNNGSNVCKDGECKGSICSYYALNQCPCTEMGYLCQVCCNNTVVGTHM